jgi:hypothetical protein
MEEFERELTFSGSKKNAGWEIKADPFIVVFNVWYCDWFHAVFEVLQTCIQFTIYRVQFLQYLLYFINVFLKFDILSCSIVKKTNFVYGSVVKTRKTSSNQSCFSEL